MLHRSTLIVALLLVLAAALPAGGEELVYTLGVGDVIHVDVYDEVLLTADYTIDSAGRIVFPLIGEVSLAGKTIRQATDTLTRLLAADYLLNPQVNVIIREYRSQRVEVLGSVERPGTFYLQRPTRLFDLLAQAGGIAPRVGAIRRGQALRITRLDTASTTQTHQINVDLYELLVEGKESANIPVAGGDVVYVPDNQSVHVIGEVKAPGTFPYEAGMTVLKAVTLAGGPSKKAAFAGATIRRIRDGKEIKVKMGLEDQLEAEDVVEVEKSFW